MVNSKGLLEACFETLSKKEKEAMFQETAHLINQGFSFKEILWRHITVNQCCENIIS